MMKVPHETDAWRKSSFSAQETDCVEARRDLAALRDSKNPAGGVLRAPLAGLLSAVKADLIAR
jgi:hypothetical protein